MDQKPLRPEEKGAAPLGPTSAGPRTHPSNNPDVQDVDAIFTFHRASDEQREQMGHIRDQAKALTRTLLLTCPPCADRSAAIRKVREAVMTANAAIMLAGK